LQTRINVATKAFYLQVRPEGPQLHPPTNTSRSNRSPRRQLMEPGPIATDEDVKRRCPRRHTGKGQTIRGGCRKVLEAVNRRINFTIEEAPFELPDKNTVVPDSSNRQILPVVSLRRDDDLLDGMPKRS